MKKNHEYLGIFFIVTQLQQQVLPALAELPNTILLSVGVHQIPFQILTGWQVTTD